MVGKPIAEGMAVGIDQNGQVAVIAAEQLSSDVYERAVAWIRQYQNTWEHSAKEELAMWEYLAREHEVSGNERIKIEENISRLQNDIRQDSFDYYRDMIYRQMELNQLSAQEEIEAWQRLVDLHEEGTSQRIAAEEGLARRREQLNQDQMNALAEMERLEAAYLTAVENRTQALVNTFDMFREVNIAETNVDRARDAMEKATEVYARATQELREAREEMSQTERGTEEFARAQERVTQANERAVQAHEELTRATEDASRSQATIMADNLQDQLDNLRDWEQELAQLAERGVYEGMISQFREMGPQTTAYLRELNASTDEELSRLSELYQEKYAESRRLAVADLQDLRHETDQAIREILADTAASMVSETNPIGMNMVEGIIQGFENKSWDLFNTIDRVMHQAVMTAQDALMIRSPSRLFAGMGENSIEGYVVGLESKEKDMYSAIDDIFSIGARDIGGLSGGLASVGHSSTGQRQAGSSSGSGESKSEAHYHFAPGSIVIDAKNVKDFNDVVELINNYTHSQRVYNGV